MADTTTSFGRRVFLRSATAAATIATIELTGAGTATAHDRNRPGAGHRRHDHRRTPHTVALPDGLQPEGIASGPGTRYYVGSLADGRIVSGDLLAGTSSVLLAAASGRSLRGLKWDPRTNLVWAAGSLGSTGKVYAVNARTGAVVADVTVPGAKFLNDLVVTSRAVWVTDSYVDRLTRVALHHGGAPSGAPTTFLPLVGAWPAGNGKDFWANGIRQLPDGSLVLNNSTVGGLWQVDRATGVARAIPVTGGPAITSGDGLELRGDLLYNVRGTGGNEVAVLRVHRRNGHWVARWRDDLTDPTLDVPSTATLAGGWLWAVNARFGVASPTTAHYWITRLPAHPH
jgi:hypothetical protein